MKGKKQSESALDDLLKEDGTLAEAEALAIQRVIAWQVKESMARKKNQQDDNGKENEYQPRDA